MNLFDFLMVLFEFSGEIIMIGIVPVLTDYE